MIPELEPIQRLGPRVVADLAIIVVLGAAIVAVLAAVSHFANDGAGPSLVVGMWGTR